MPVLTLPLLLVPLTYLLPALLPEQLFARQPERRWTGSLVAMAAAALLALLAAAALAVSGPSVTSLPLSATLAISLRLDALTAVMLVLITGIAAIILLFSKRYLAGEAGRPQYVRCFLATMASVSLLVATNDLLVLALAWTISSLTLHQLLTFYGDRAPALIAAHKKFLLSRVADVVIFAAVALIWRSAGTQRIDELVTWAQQLRDIPALVQLAGVLLVTGVGIRSAQLPFHGWLIQVMEAPTPVSAFLHAGIVNIGGFVLIRLGFLLGQLETAQTLLVLAGTCTAVLAALVMTTRVSVKVSLAWSTCAQMGFMLLECGLGAYGLALLHLVAHSLYKAHAFLSSGRTVEQLLRRRMTPAIARPTPSHWLLGAVASAVIVFTLGPTLGLRTGGETGTRAALLILTFALAPLFVSGFAAGTRSLLRNAVAAALLVATYALGHAVFTTLAPDTNGSPTMDLLRLGFVALAFAALFIVQAAIATEPAGRLARALYPACFAGFYLDEIWTRLTFRIWPPRSLPLPPGIASPSALVLREVHA
ncbi:MAG TPA: NADH-quinone oxidoreductase subunit L [Gemmatimonadaceae bacterium]|nr:NADH-quinone oxidoreductase subunit L [Gemmatimonadaceae bacterium]